MCKLLLIFNAVDISYSSTLAMDLLLGPDVRKFARHSVLRQVKLVNI